MQKLSRSYTLLAVVALSITPALNAETMGTNPRPHVAVAQPTFLATVQYMVFAYLGF
jgi:hypothetical protein